MNKLSEEEKECIKLTIKYAYTHICDFEPEKSETIKKAEKTIETILAELEKKDKIIDAMTQTIIESSICDYFIKPKCKHYAGENKLTCDVCIKQYYERKINYE